MKVLSFKIPKSAKDILIVQEDKGKTFYERLHQHEEIQISYIVKGQGLLVIGDAIKTYKANDIIAFGSNVPHVLKSDIENGTESCMISIFFTKNSFGPHFFELLELQKIKRLIEDTFFGVKLVSNKKLLKKFKIIKQQNTIKRYITFFEILEILTSFNYETISSFNNKRVYTDYEGKRMSDVFEFTMNNFDTEISLKQISSIANMTPNAFCRYFKIRTNKTYFQVLIEVRIEKSCRYLAEKSNLTISEISYRCGFKNISNFNRKFKEVKGKTPTQFQNNLLLEKSTLI